MELSFKNNNFFFTISSSDWSGGKVSKDISGDVISLSIVEEIDKMITGSLSVRDDSHLYSNALKSGMTLKLSWGRIGTSGLKLMKREGVTVYTASPAGSGNDSGQCVYSITFYGSDILSAKEKKVFENGTKQSVVTEVLSNLGVKQSFIDFEKGKDIVGASTSIRQFESDFSFIYRLAKEWRCMFSVGYSKNGVMTGLFIDSKKIGSATMKSYLSIVSNSAMGEKRLFFNAAGASNVVSYSWQQHIGDCGSGDNVQIRNVGGVDGGQFVFTKKVAGTQTVKTWRLNVAKIQAAIAKAGRSDLWDKIASKNFLGAKDFKDIEWAFDAYESTTAPEGLGYTVNVSLIGDPYTTPWMKVFFASGFPLGLTQNQVPLAVADFFVRKATHTFSKSGYMTEIEVVDSFTQFGLLGA